MANEIKFKYGSGSDYDTVVSNESISDGDVYFTTSSSTDDPDVVAGTIYRGGEIMGTAAADKLILTEDLALIGQSFGNFSDGDSIPAGTSIYDLLKQALQQELWPTQSLTTSASVTLSATSSPSGDVEVGSTVSTTLSYSSSSTASYSTYPANGGTSTTTVSVTARPLSSISLSRTAPTSEVLSTDLVAGASYTDSGISLDVDGKTVSYTLSAVFGTLSDVYTQYSNMGNERTVTNTATSTLPKTSSKTSLSTARYRYYIGCTSATDPSEITQDSLSSLVSLNGYSSTTGLMSGTSVTVTGDTVISSTADANSIVAIMPASLVDLKYHKV